MGKLKGAISVTKFNFKFLDLIKELVRKIIHISSCLGALYALSNNYTLLEALILPAVISATFIAERIEFFNRNISFGKNRKWGGIYLAIGLTIVLFSPVDYEVKKFAILILGIADAGAAIVGRIIPIVKFRVFDGNKSIGGSLAFLAGAILAMYLSFGIEGRLAPTILIALILAFIEFLNYQSLDNISLPIFSLVLASQVL